MEPTTHIVYRSKAEAAMDAFWWDFMSDHPTLTLVVVLALPGVMFALWAWLAFRTRRRW